MFVGCCFDFGLFMVYEKAQGGPSRALRGRSPLVCPSGRHGTRHRRVDAVRCAPPPADGGASHAHPARVSGVPSPAAILEGGGHGVKRV